MKDQAPAPNRREDLLVSVCVPQIDGTMAAFAELRQLAEQLDAAYRFWELVLVATPEEAVALTPLVGEISNLKLLKVRQGTGFYRRRVVAADEAIGDIVAVIAMGELSALDIPALAAAAWDGDRVMIAERSATGARERMLSHLLRRLGAGAGFSVAAADMQTMAFPRTQLNRVLGHPDPELALRFLPRDDGLRVGRVVAGGAVPRSSHRVGQRTRLVHALLINLAPWLLLYVSLASALLALMGLVYAIYAVIAWAVLPEVQPGWLTISLMLSMTACFLGCAIFGLSLGLQHVLSRLDRDTPDDVVGEVTEVDLFGQVARDLNVQIEASGAGHDQADNRS